jgi:hypothetical protein
VEPEEKQIDMFAREARIETMSAYAHAEHAQSTKAALEWVARSIGQHKRRFEEGLGK